MDHHQQLWAYYRPSGSADPPEVKGQIGHEYVRKYPVTLPTNYILAFVEKPADSDLCTERRSIMLTISRLSIKETASHLHRFKKISDTQFENLVQSLFDLTDQ